VNARNLHMSAYNNLTRVDEIPEAVPRGVPKRKRMPRHDHS